jgi:chemotaxis protein CheC
MSSVHLSELQHDVLRELINIGIGNAAGVLNQMVNSHVTLQVPQVMVLSPAELLRQPSTCRWGKGVIINMVFGGSFEGVTALVFSPQSAFNLVSLLVGQEDFGLDMDSLRIGTLQEVGNIVLNGVMGSIANMLSEHIDYMPPDYFEDEIINVLFKGGDEDSVIIFIRANFLIQEHLVEGEVFIFFNSSTLRELLKKIDATLDMA